jgi:hypothetical protein
MVAAPLLANQPLQWTVPALSVLVNWECVGAVPAIERRSVMRQTP